MSSTRLSRRRAVRLSGSLLIAVLAGCPGDPNGAETATETAGGTTASDTAEPGSTAAAESTETRTQTLPESASAGESVTPAVSVSDQTTSGETITVGRVAVDRSDWLVVHPAADGGPDTATYLAAVALDPGRHTDLRVTLDPTLSADRTLYAMLHHDDPADGSFTFAPGRGDDPPVTADGERVVDAFVVTVK